MGEQQHYSPERAKTFLQTVKSAIEGQTKVTLKMAELLYNVFYGTVQTNTGAMDLVHFWNFDDFDHFAEAEEGLNMHMGTARRYVHMWDELFVRRQLDVDILPYSVTKLFQLAKLSKHCEDTKRFMKWVGKAKEMTCCEFEEAVETEFGGGADRFKAISFSIRASARNGFMKKLKTARNLLGVNSNVDALSGVLDEWLAAHKTDQVRKKVG